MCGVQGHGEGLVRLAHWWALRHAAYLKFVIEVHKYVAHMLRADTDARNVQSLRRLGLRARNRLRPWCNVQLPTEARHGVTLTVFVDTVATAPPGLHPQLGAAVRGMLQHLRLQPV